MNFLFYILLVHLVCKGVNQYATLKGNWTLVFTSLEMVSLGLITQKLITNFIEPDYPEYGEYLGLGLAVLIVMTIYQPRMASASKKADAEHLN